MLDRTTCSVQVQYTGIAGGILYEKKTDHEFQEKFSKHHFYWKNIRQGDVEMSLTQSTLAMKGSTLYFLTDFKPR